jgi:hypothetical protein
MNALGHMLKLLPMERIVAGRPYQTIHIDGAPYLTRYFLTSDGPRRALGTPSQAFIHHFHSSDPKPGRGLHNHPWTGTSLILQGGYVEERCTDIGTPSVPGVYTEVTERVCLPGTVNHIGLHDFHRATLLDLRRGCWTLFVTGPRVNAWGFLDETTHRFTPHDYKTSNHKRSSTYHTGRP